MISSSLVGGLHVKRIHGSAEPADVIVQAEEGAIPYPHHVVGHVGAAIAPVGQRDSGLAHRHVAAVDVSGPGGEA